MISPNFKIQDPTSSNEQFVYRQLIQSLPIAIYGCDAEGRITFFNQAATDIWGREAEIGKDRWSGALKLFKPDGSVLPMDSCPLALALKEGRAVLGEEIIIERPDGTRCNVLPHPQLVFNDLGIVIGAVNSLVDITKQKNDQKVLNELERSNNELTSFSYIASHDMQEPLRKIITFSDKLKEEFKETIPEEGKEYIGKIITSSKRMRKLIEDILNFSRVSNSEKQFTLIDLQEILQQALSDFDQKILEKKATITMEKLPVIRAVELQMSQLFHNLLSNALKFSSTENAPEINFSSRKLSSAEIKKLPGLNKDRSYIELIVKDNGIGFSQEYAEKIFAIFQRLHGHSQYSGTGIGLALCRKIVDNHYGVIYAKSILGSGSEFHVILPVDPD